MSSSNHKKVFNIIKSQSSTHFFHQERNISGFDTVGYASIRKQNLKVLFLLANFSLSWACDNYKHDGNTSNNHLLLDIDCSSFLSFCFDISACWPSKLTSTAFWCLRLRIKTESFTFLLLILRIEVIAWTKCLGDSVFPPEQKHGDP